MTTILRSPEPDPRTDRYMYELESALLAQAIAETSDVSAERKKALLQLWMVGTFDAAAAGIETGFSGCGYLEWQEEGSIRHLMYHAPYGIACHLGRVYRQSDGSWAALVIAGVKDDPHEAMATAEWAISRLTAA